MQSKPFFGFSGDVDMGVMLLKMEVVTVEIFGCENLDCWNDPTFEDGYVVFLADLINFSLTQNIHSLNKIPLKNQLKKLHIHPRKRGDSINFLAHSNLHEMVKALSSVETRNIFKFEVSCFA